MQVQVNRTTLQEINHFRLLFLHEGNFQFTYDKCHYYGWADTYVFSGDGKHIGYGAVWGKEKREDRDSIMEFFVLMPFRHYAELIFREFVAASKAKYIECQSNDLLLTDMLYRYTENIFPEAVLFEEHHQTDLYIPGASLRRDEPAISHPNDMGGYYIEHNGIRVASGGFMLNYNIPYADIYMEVKEEFRKSGFGALIVQELKKEIYLLGRKPAARCNINNLASKRTIQKAGFRICGYRLGGALKELLNPIQGTE